MIHLDLFLILIVLHKVKVDLANFDVKFHTKFLSIKKKKNTYSCINVFQIFLNFQQDIKNYVLTSILMYEYVIRSLAAATPCWPLLLLSFTAIKDHPRAGEISPGCGPQCSTSQDSYQFLVSGRIEWGGGGFWVGLALLLFLIGQLVPHHFGKIPETRALCDKLCKYQGRWV